MKTPYETLHTRLNELLPDLVELKFGCEVKINVMDTEMVVIIDNADVMVNGKNGIKFSDSDCYDCVEILGRPLHIGDVLRAVDNPKFFVDTNGWLGEMISVAPIVCKSKVKFNLSLPLSDPSNAKACEFIYHLIK